MGNLRSVYTRGGHREVLACAGKFSMSMRRTLYRTRPFHDNGIFQYTLGHGTVLRYLMTVTITDHR